MDGHTFKVLHILTLSPCRSLLCFQSVVLSLLSTVFVRDGIPSVADYNLTLMGVVVVVVVVVEAIFTMG